MVDEDRNDAAIRRLLAEYCQRCDEGRLDELVELFTDDGTFAFGRREVTGHADLIEYFEWAQAPDKRGTHITSNVVVDVDLDGEGAVASSDYVFLARRDGVIVPLAAGRYTDDLRRVGGRWRIRRRSATNL